MILSIIIILLIGVVAYFHYVQGLFSATMSAFAAIISAVLAVSYQEPVVNLLLKGKMADQANAMIMSVMFAAGYLILRIIFDKAIPGNVRVPLLVDRIGAAVMGVVVGIFATGIFALAAQMLPFGPSIGGYARYSLRDTQAVVVPTRPGYQDVDSSVYDEMSKETFEPGDEHSLLVPVDDIVLATVQHLSDGGGLAGDRTLASIHPDYPQELFGNRLGIQVGARRSALNLGSENAISVPGVYTVSSLPTADPEFKQLRSGRKIEPVTKPESAQQVLLIVRVMVGHSAADDADNLFRFSTGSVRLVAGEKNYYPIGVVDNASILMSQKLGDFLFLDLKTADTGFDAAFLVDRADLFGSSAPTEDKIAPGTFIEVKRFAKVDLSGQTVNAQGYQPSPSIAVLRKKIAMDQLKLPAVAPVQQGTPPPPSAPVQSTPTPAPPQSNAIETPPPAPTPPPAAPSDADLLDGSTAKISSTIAVTVGVNGTDPDQPNIAVVGGTVSLKDAKLLVVKVDPTDTLDKLAKADNQITDLFVPTGKKAVQVNLKPVNGWTWTGSLTSLKITDAAGNGYLPNGVYTVVDDGSKKGLLMRYDAQQTLSPLTPANGTPGNVTVIYLIPVKTQLKDPVSLNVQ
jgi:Colicin V production protein